MVGPGWNRTVSLAGKGNPAGFWNRLTEDDQSAFKKLARSRTFAPRTRLIEAGEAGTWAAVLVKGTVQVLAADESRKIAVRRSADIIGEQAVLDGGVRSATVLAETVVEALVISRRDLEHLLHLRPQVTRLLVAIMSERLRESDGRQGGGPVVVRLARLIVALAAERGVQVGGRLHIRVNSQQALAATLGVARMSVVRGLDTLRREGLVTASRGLLVVHDLDGLRERPVR
jgi:CRP-like cAMP-binding protein